MAMPTVCVGDASPSTNKQSGLTVCLWGTTMGGCPPSSARPRPTAPARCGCGCWRRRSSCWSSAASPGRRRPWSPSGPGSRAARSSTTSRPRTTSSSPRSSTSPSCAAPSSPRRWARCRAGAGRTRAVLRVLGDHFSSPVFTAALELWVAARTDEALLAAVAPLEQRVGRETHRLTVEALGVDESRPGVRELVQATLDLVRGLGLADTITDDTRRRRRILDQWARTLDHDAGSAAHERHAATRCSPTSPPRATGSTTLVVRPARGRLADADPGRRLGRRHPGRPPRLDRRGRAARPPPTGPAWDALVLDGARGPRRLRRRTALAGGAVPPADLLARWRTARTALAAALRDLPGRGEDAVVRPADVGDVDGDRALHGDLGPLPRRARGARGRAGGRRRIRHVAHLGVRTRGFAFAVHGLEPPTEEFRVELTAPSGDLWSWGPEDAAQTVRGSASTSAGW